MEVVTQNFDEPVIDWTKTNLLSSTRMDLIVMNDPTVEVDDYFSGTVLSYQPSDPGNIEYVAGEYLTDFNPLTFKMFNGQVSLSNS